MKSAIDEMLSEEERRVLAVYRDPSRSGMGRMLRLSIQYAIAGGIFTGLSIAYNEPAFGLIVYGLFLSQLAIRIFGARKLAGIVPGVIEKYESRVRELSPPKVDGA